MKKYIDMLDLGALTKIIHSRKKKLNKALKRRLQLQRGQAA